MEDSVSCQPETKYWKYMSTKYIVFLENYKRFESDNYSDETPVVNESSLRWI